MPSAPVRVVRGTLPPEIVDRPKHGFAIPLSRWFRGELTGFVNDLLLSPASRQRGFFQAGYIEKLVGLHHRGRDLDLQLWTLISFEMWCRKFLDRAPAPIKGAETAQAVLRVAEPAKVRI